MTLRQLLITALLWAWVWSLFTLGEVSAWQAEANYTLFGPQAWARLHIGCCHPGPPDPPTLTALSSAFGALLAGIGAVSLWGFVAFSEPEEDRDRQHARSLAIAGLLLAATVPMLLAGPAWLAALLV